jgi:Tfp pilus assembly protein PilN
MSRTPKPDQVCIGISIEGDILRLAAVGREGKTLRILDLASMPIPIIQKVLADKDDSSNPFDRVELTDTDEVDYTSVKDFLTAHFIPGATLAVSLGDQNIRTFLMPCETKDSPAKIVKRILAEVQHLLNLELTKDQVAYELVGKTHLVASVRIESMLLLEILALPHGASRRGTRITSVTSNDVALVNLVRVHFRFRGDDIVHIIHVGKDETRLYIMRGYDLVFISPPVQQGANDREYVTMLNNRLELAAENAGYPKASAVVLSGFGEDIGLREEILENNPTVVFHTLSKMRLDHGSNEALAREMRHFPIAISIAWEKLQPKNPHFYRINLIPQRIREEQRKMKLAWHGILLLIVLFAATAGLTVLGLQKGEQIRTMSSQLAYERKQVKEQRAIVVQINDLESRSASLVQATNTLDTLLLNSEKYSETLDTLAIAAGGLRNMWINEIKPDADGNIAITGFSLTRPSVPTFSHLVGQTNMREISVQEIGKKKVYRFDVSLHVPDAYPYANSPAQAWHDTIKTTLGDVSTRFAAEKPKHKDVKEGKGKKGKKGEKGAKAEKGKKGEKASEKSDATEKSGKK